MQHLALLVGGVDLFPSRRLLFWDLRRQTKACGGVRKCISSPLAIVVALVGDCLLFAPPTHTHRLSRQGWRGGGATWATAEWGTSEHLSGEECGLMGF